MKRVSTTKQKFINDDYNEKKLNEFFSLIMKSTAINQDKEIMIRFSGLFKKEFYTIFNKIKKESKEL